jgi:N-acetylglucosamine-6-phosphate deacetylase
MTNSAHTVDGYIATNGGFVDGSLAIESGRVAAIAGTGVNADQVRDGRKPIVIPGFVDLHVHGGGGVDIMDAEGASSIVTGLHVKHGTTSLLATTLTSPTDSLQRALADLARVNAAQRTGSRMLGVHLEGPYINDNKLGAQPAFTRPFDIGEVHSLHRLFPIRLITLAPEIEGGIQAIETLTAAGFRVQIGHTTATYEVTKMALDAGAVGFTHLFNAMSGLHHRAPGAVGAALAHGEYAEIIPDLQHVHPGAIRVALRAMKCLYCVTDSTAAAGMPDGQYRLGPQVVNKCLGGVRLADGTLAGSTLTMDEAFRNLVNVLELSIIEASKRTSTYAADFLGATDRGRIAMGAWADLVVMDRDLKIANVWVEGNEQRL